jgi:tripartite-type tricarboxylate transporter receptor subunit TctC
VLNDPVVLDKLRALGIEAKPGSDEQFRDEIKRDLARYGQVVKAAGIQID